MRPEHPSDPPKQLVPLPRGPVAVTDVGRGPAFVALHGLPGGARDWRWLGTLLEPEARLVRVELPGSGDTPLADLADWEIPRRAALVLEVLDALALREVTVVGHSMGGAIAAEMARQDTGGRLARVAFLACPGPRIHKGLRGQPLGKLSRALANPAGRLLLRRPLRTAFTAAGFPRSLSDSDRAAAIHGSARLRFERHRENLEALALPTLVAWAEDDPLIEPPVSEALAEISPGGPRLRFPDGGHNIQKTRAVEIAGALLDWIRPGQGAG
jgi:pimeloyl-ACP methyl ester carboxylesterase